MTIAPRARPPWAAAILLAVVWAIASGQNAAAPIHFAYRHIDFKLDSCETPQRHAPETMAGGVAIFDYNNDGFLDIFFTNGADIRTLKKSSSKYSNRLFENDGKGNFKDVTVKAGLAGVGFDDGVAIGDYDNDGYKDIFVGGVHGNRLYHNNGDGTFTDVTAKAGLDRPDSQYGPLWSVGGAWVDVNNDGLLDLFVVNYLAWDIDTEPACEAGPGKLDYCHPKFYKPTANQLFLNNGDGTFRDISAESGIRAHPGKGMGVGIADYDLDGLMDIFVTNDKMENSLFHNKGGAKFEEIAFDAGVALAEDGKFISGMGVDFRDIDNDGLPDIAFVALDHETFPLFRNLGKRGFADITGSSGMARLSTPMAGYSPTIADFDNDGWKDIFVTRGHVQSLGYASKVQVEQPNTVFRNLGGAKFEALDRRSRFDRAATQPASGLGGRRPEWRWAPGRGGDGPGRTRRDLVQRQPRRQALAGVRPAGDDEQSRWDRSQNQGDGRREGAVQPRFIRRRLRFLQRGAHALRVGREPVRGCGGNPLAFGDYSGAEERGGRSGGQGHRA